MKQVVYLLLIALLLFSFTSTQPSQGENNQNQNPDGNQIPNQNNTTNQEPNNNPNPNDNKNQNQNENQNQNPNQNSEPNPNQNNTDNQIPNNNPNQGGNQDPNQNQNGNQNQTEPQNPKENEINCNENKNNPQCLKEESTKLYEEMKSAVPEFFKDMKNNSEIFSQLDTQQQNGKLDEQKQEFKVIKEEFKGNQIQETRKQTMEKATEIAEFLTKKDCSTKSNSSSDMLKDDSFNDCREEKKEILTDVISYVKDYVKCENIDELISSGVSDSKQ